MSRRPDAIVIGGGAMGCSVAHALAREGAEVTLLDAQRAGRATSASAGGLWAIGESVGLGCGVILQEGTPEPEPLPSCFMEFLIQSNRMFPPLCAELREETGIDIEAEQGTGLLYLIYDEDQNRHAVQILEWLGDDPSVAERWAPDSVHDHDPLVTRDLLGAIHFPGDNQVNPMLLAEGLKRALCARRGRFLADARVTGFDTQADRVTGVHTTCGVLRADVVIDAAGAWSPELSRMLGVELPVFPVRGQILCTEMLDSALRCNLSTRDCYLLQKAHGEVLIGSTTEHVGYDASVDTDCLRALARGARRAVPGLASVAIKRSWAGLRPGTPDELPILGPAADYANLFHATGGFRTGLVGAPLTGAMVAASVLGKQPPFALDPFLVSRFDD